MPVGQSVCLELAGFDPFQNGPLETWQYRATFCGLIVYPPGSLLEGYRVVCKYTPRPPLRIGLGGTSEADLVRIAVRAAPRGFTIEWSTRYKDYRFANDNPKGLFGIDIITGEVKGKL